MGRRPYRVVFVPAGHTGPGRPGVIVARDEQAAHREARRVADAGGWAQVQHLSEDGRRHVLAVYPQEGVDAEPAH